VHLSLRRFAAKNQAMLYSQVRRIDWPSLFSPERTIAIEAHGSTQGTDFALSFAPLKVKDAICDEFRKRGQERPGVDRREPDIRLTAFFFEGRCELSMDLAGEPLHRRGYRLGGAEAPIRENRAAALLLFAGYDGSSDFVDPFCGSGTLPIEAALIATKTAPGLLRPTTAYSLGRIVPEAKAHLESERENARTERIDRPPCRIVGMDLSEAALEIARANARRAGVLDHVEFRAGDARSLEAPQACIVTNPPYGERLQDPEAAMALLKEFVHGVKHKSVGARLALVLPRGDLEKSVGLKPEKRLAVESGSLGLRYLTFAIQSGKFVRG
jgi:23S rRNA G2445 N2-methylase RlmL